MSRLGSNSKKLSFACSKIALERRQDYFLLGNAENRSLCGSTPTHQICYNDNMDGC